MSDVTASFHGRSIRLSRLLAFAPAIAWAALIFTMSTEPFSRGNTREWIERPVVGLWPSTSKKSVRRIHTRARDLGHVAEYFVLTLLLARGFHVVSGAAPAAVALKSVAAATMYAFSDEAHQALVRNRTASLTDCARDALGALLAAIALSLRTRRHSTRPCESRTEHPA